MEIGTNDDFIDEIDEIDDEITDTVESQEEIQDVQDSIPENEEENVENEDFETSLLKARGIEDKSKIKFENEDGEVEEVDWDNLSNEDKFNILQSTEASAESGLDDSEIQLINAIRESGMTPSEYLNYISGNEVQRYIQNNSQPSYEIDQYSDDELYLMDLISRMGDISEDEAREALDRAKANENLYRKQVDAIRNEYKQAEQENKLQEQMEQDQIAQQQYEQFSNQIVDEINNLTEIQGFDLNMNDEDMQTLYDFITGQDAAGNNYFAKALSDPKILVKTAWLALNGDQMVSDISNYFQKEISNVRKESYKKGANEAQNKINKQSNKVVFKDKKGSQHEYYSDLDDF